MATNNADGGQTSATSAAPAVNNDNFVKNSTGGFVNLAFADPSIKGGKIYSAAEAGLGNPNTAAAVTSESQANSNAGAIANGQNPNSGFISSSSNVQNGEIKTANDVTDAMVSNPSAADAHTNYLSFLDQQQALLQQRLQAQTDSINAGFDATKVDTKAAQAKEEGTQAVTMQRMGGYLGEGASQVQAMSSLIDTHKTELVQLEQKRQSALQDANNAVNDQSFKLAQAKLQEAKDYAQQISDRKDKYFSQMLEYQKAEQDKNQFNVTQAQNKLKDLSVLSPEDIKSLPEGTLATIDAAYGIQGFAQKYLDVSSAMAAAKSEGDAVALHQKYIDLAQSVPNGQSVTFPDGSTVTGMGKTADISTFMEEDSATGQKYLVTYDKGSGQINRIATGITGTSTGSGNITGDLQTLGDLMKKRATVNTGTGTKDPLTGATSNSNATGYVSPDYWMAQKRQFLQIHPGKGSDYDSQFLNYLAPQDRYLTK